MRNGRLEGVHRRSDLAERGMHGGPLERDAGIGRAGLVRALELAAPQSGQAVRAQGGFHERQLGRRHVDEGQPLEKGTLRVSLHPAVPEGIAQQLVGRRESRLDAERRAESRGRLRVAARE